MLSLRELRRCVALIDADLAGSRVERILEPAPRRLLLALHRSGAGKRWLLLSAEPQLARIALVEKAAPAPPKPPHFTQLLRARLGDARLLEARLVDGDRQAGLRFEGSEGRFELMLSLMGPRSNVYLLDDAGTLVGSLRPLSETRRDLSLGDRWRRPESAPPPEGEDRFADAPDAGLFAAVEAAYRKIEGGRADDTLRRRLERALRQRGKSLAKKRAALERDARSGEEVPDLRRRGELLKSSLDRVRPGEREVAARDFETGEEVRIELDPSRSPRANLEDYFRRARKAEKRAARAGGEMVAVEEREAEQRGLQAELDALLEADDKDALQTFAAREEVAALLDRFAPPPRGAPAEPAVGRPEGPKPLRLGKRELPGKLQPRRYRSSDGLEIWVGRSDEGNDLLSTRLARGNDLFFHLDASPGSHVVLRTEGRSDPPQESLLEACELAVHFSKQKKASRTDVLIAPCKNVRKPRGAKPGLVYVSGGRSVHLRRDPRRLERILGARIEA